MSEAYVHPAALVEGSVGPGTRVWAFAHVLAGATVGADCNIGEHCYVESGAVVGDGVTIKNGIAVWDGVVLEDGVFVGPGVVFTNDRRPRSPRLAEAAARYETDEWLERTLVRRGATLGAGAVLVAPVTVGEFAFVAAGALVARDVPAHGLVVGSPARAAGWVCCCGESLVLEGEAATCSSCGRRFRLEGDELLAQVV